MPKLTACILHNTKMALSVIKTLRAIFVLPFSS